VGGERSGGPFFVLFSVASAIVLPMAVFVYGFELNLFGGKVDSSSIFAIAYMPVAWIVGTILLFKKTNWLAFASWSGAALGVAIIFVLKV